MKFTHTDPAAIYEFERPKNAGDVRHRRSFLWWPYRIGNETRWLEYGCVKETARMRPEGIYSLGIFGYAKFASHLYWDEAWCTENEYWNPIK